MKSHFLLSSSQSEIESRLFVPLGWIFSICRLLKISLYFLQVKRQMPKICRDYSAKSPRIRDCNIISIWISFLNCKNKFDSSRNFCHAKKRRKKLNIEDVRLSVTFLNIFMPSVISCITQYWVRTTLLLCNLGVVAVLSPLYNELFSSCEPPGKYQ